MTSRISSRIEFLSYHTSVFDIDLTANERLVYIVLWSFADADGSKCFPGHKAIIERTHLGRTTVKKVLSDLRKKGVITATENHTGGYDYGLMEWGVNLGQGGQEAAEGGSLDDPGVGRETPPTGCHLTGSHLQDSPLPPSRGENEKWVSWWNDEIVPLQPTLLPKLKKISGARGKKLKLRLKEEPYFREEVKGALSGPLAEFVMEGTWLTFDWIIKSDTNYAKLVEGNFRDQKASKPIPNAGYHEAMKEKARKITRAPQSSMTVAELREKFGGPPPKKEAE